MDGLAPGQEQRVRDSFAKQAAMAEIGARLGEIAAGTVTVELPFSARWTQQHGLMHGGVIGMIADTACGFAALSVMPANAAVLTAEYKLHLLSPAQGDRFVATGRVVRRGRRLIVCLGEVFAEAQTPRKQIALVTASMMVVESAGQLKD